MVVSSNTNQDYYILMVCLVAFMLFSFGWRQHQELVQARAEIAKLTRIIERKDQDYMKLVARVLQEQKKGGNHAVKKDQGKNTR